MEILRLVGRSGMYCSTSLDAPVFLLALAKAGKSPLASHANFSPSNPYNRWLQMAEMVAHSANKSECLVCILAPTDAMSGLPLLPLPLNRSTIHKRALVNVSARTHILALYDL